MGLLTETAKPAKAILGVETIDVVADKGYLRKTGKLQYSI